MTDTSEAELGPQTNGLPEDADDDEKSKMRPADIDADMREMERRKRVEMIMGSRLFREELERIIDSQMKEGGGPSGLLQKIQDMVGGAGRLHSTSMFRNSNCVLPINDIRGVESMGYAKGEKILRCKLASVFRLMDLYGWTHGIHNHITARLNQDDEHFLVNPFGMLYHEITASSLVKVDMQGAIVESGTTNFGVNIQAFELHAAIHASRPDVKCIIHIHTPSVLAVSSVKCGLLPVSAESIVIGEVSQHPYLGSVSEPEEKDKIARNLGPINKVVFLSNHGALCCGETIEEAFFNVYNTVLACETQVKLMPLGIDNLVLIPDETRKHIYDSARKMPEGAAPTNSTPLPPNLEKKEKRWRIGGFEFEALMRMLDNAGFRTGYIYRTPLVKGDPPRPRNDVEVPPAVSSLGYLLEEEEMYKQGNWKRDGRGRSDRTRWLNSPNVYQKVEILETGTPDPKKITKWVDANNPDEWVAEGSPTHSSTPVKIDAALQFVPKNTNPKEFKKIQQQIKENRRADKITSGPQSHILEGVSWEEAKKLQDANMSSTGDQVIIVGAASKGIIQRGYQHNATVYKTPYAKNPFDAVSDHELEEYKKVVTRKQKGDYYDEDQSESEALSSSAALPPTGLKSPPSETDEESRTEPRVLRIETKTAPLPSQAEVVLSDDGLPLGNFERSKSQRYPTPKVPDQQVFKRSSSLGRTKSILKDSGAELSRSPVEEKVILTKAKLKYFPDITDEKQYVYLHSSPSAQKIHTADKSTQTNLSIRFLDDDEIGCYPPLKFVGSTPNIKDDIPPPKPPKPLCSLLKEQGQKQDMMFKIHQELSLKLGSNLLKLKKIDQRPDDYVCSSQNEKVELDEQKPDNYTTCTLYSLPESKSLSKGKVVLQESEFSSSSAGTTCSSIEDTELEPDKKVSPQESLLLCIGEEYELGETTCDSPEIMIHNKDFKEGSPVSLDVEYGDLGRDTDSSIISDENDSKVGHEIPENNKTSLTTVDDESPKGINGRDSFPCKRFLTYVELSDSESEDIIELSSDSAMEVSVVHIQSLSEMNGLIETSVDDDFIPANYVGAVYDSDDSNSSQLITVEDDYGISIYTRVSSTPIIESQSVVKSIINDLIDECIALFDMDHEQNNNIIEPQYEFRDDVLKFTETKSFMIDCDNSGSSGNSAHYDIDSGYEADTDKTVYHNGTQLFAQFTLDFLLPEEVEVLGDVPPPRDLSETEEFLILESAVNLGLDEGRETAKTPRNSVSSTCSGRSSDVFCDEASTSFSTNADAFPTNDLYTIYECSSETSDH